jgi:nitronate monooxygenase
MGPQNRNALCTLLGIEHPILQSGMGRIAGPDLVARVSTAGGLGILAGLLVPPEDLRALVRRVRELTERPFGVNLWLHEALCPPDDPGSIPADDLARAQAALNRFRAELGVAERAAPPLPVPDLVDAQIRVLLAERIPVFSVGLGDPGRERVRAFHEHGARVIAMACTVDDARALEASGVDVIVAQGSEAGGHRSTWTRGRSAESAAVGTMALVPEVVDAVSVPVVAAGGIADGRGLVAALALGAQGVMFGTRFVATQESMAAPFFKDAIVRSTADKTRITSVYTGLPARGITNRFATEYAASGAPVLPPMLQTNAAQDVYVASAMRGDPSFFPMLAGQSVGLVVDVPSAADVVAAIVREADEVRARLGGNPRALAAPQAINGMAHVQLTVSSFAAARDFYGKLLPFLGLTPFMDLDGFYYCVGGRTGVAISTADEAHRAERFVQRRVGLHHLCFRARDRAEVDRAHTFLVQMDAKIVHAPEEAAWAPGYYSLLFEDPDGIRLEMNHVPGKGLLR